MPLRIVRESDPIVVTQLTMCFYAPPGLGKTSLGFTADDPLLLDFDKGAHRSRNRRDCVPISKWDDIAYMEAEDFAAHKTAIVDTGGRALDMLSQDILREDPKAGKGGVLNIQGFGKLRNSFVSWLSLLRSYGKDVAILVHGTEEKKGDVTHERLDMQGGSKAEVYKVADMMGRLYIENGERWLSCEPGETSFGKNPVGMAPMRVPDFSDNPNFLGQVIRQVKEAMNRQTDAQLAAAGYVEAWKDKTLRALTAEDFNSLREDILAVEKAGECSDAQGRLIKRLISDTAATQNVVYDKSAKLFVAEAA